jgi:tetratricopeptide (TPR) repeat protein
MLDRSNHLIPNRVRGASAGRTTATLTALVALVALGGPVACGGDGPEPVVREQTRPVPTTTGGPAYATKLVAARADQRTEARSDTALPPVRTDVTYEEAEAAFRSGAYREAVSLFEGYIAGHPDNPWGHYMLGMSAWKGGHDEKAIEAFEAALERNPDHLKSLVNLSRVRLEAGRPDEASISIERALELEPGSGEAWRVAGNVRSDLDLENEALDAYRRAIAIDPDDAWAMNNLGLVLIRQGRWDEALGPLARATELKPEVGVFQNNLGSALERTGYLTEAEDAFRAAVASEEGSGKAAESLARVEARTVGRDAPDADLVGLAAAFLDEVEGWRSSLLAVAATVGEEGG